MENKRFYQQAWFIILMLFIFAPVGIALMWQYTNWNKVVKIILSVLFGLVFIFALIGSFTEDKNEIPDVSDTQQEQQVEESGQAENDQTEAENTEEADEAKEEEPEAEPVEKPKKSAYDKLSTEEKNAYNSAKNYLEFSAFSKQGLIDQLSSEYGDNYPADVAKKAVNTLEKEEKIDWIEQAKKSAQQYMDMMSFSKQGLIDQLESEYGDKYTHEQAVQAVEEVYK